MTTGGDHSHPKYQKYWAHYKKCCWKPIHYVGCLIAKSFQEPNNIPVYLTALFTLLLAIFAYKAWDEATRGTKALEGQLRAIQTDQRPVISLTNDLRLPEFIFSTQQGVPVTTGQIIWNWQFTNAGRGVAYEFKYTHFMKVGSGQYEISYGSHPSPAVGINVPFGKTNFSTAISHPGIKKEDFDLAMKANQALGLLLEWSYKDVYGNTYSDIICFERLGGGGLGYIDPAECEKQKAK